MALILNGTTGFDLPVPLATTEGGTGLSSPGTAGYLLTSDGTGWISAPAPISLPSQTGNNGKYLTTDGSTASWVTLNLSTISGGTLTVSGTPATGATLRLYEDTDNGTNYVAFKAADTIASSVVWTLPSADGTGGQFLTTNGSGTLSWTTLNTITGGVLNVAATNALGSSIRVYEDSDNGTNYVGLKSPDNLAASITFTLPGVDGAAGQALTTNGSGSLSWAAAGATITDDTSTNASYYPSLETATTGSSTAVKVSSTKLYFNPSTGTLNATIFNSLSDATQKTNVVKIENATETIKKIDGVEFNWTESGKHSTGVIAQKLEEILPFLVETNENGIKSVNYSGLIAYLIQSNKELAARVEALETK